MDLDNVYICDIEAKSLLDGLKSFDDFHVLSVAFKNKEGKWEVKSFNKKEHVQKLVGNSENTLVFHNGISYDKPALIKMGLDFKATVIDSLFLSYYLYSELDKHGLDRWGEILDNKKPEIEDWENLTYEEYKHRCEEDVKINTKLWVRLYKYLLDLYDGDKEAIIKTIKYLNFKAEKLFIQSQNPLLIDVEKCSKNIAFLEGIIEEKKEALHSIMPKLPKYTVKGRPKKPFKQDGTLSAVGKVWYEMLSKLGLAEDYDGEIKVVVDYAEPNPSSHQQIKDFLYTKKWKPKIFKDGANGKVAQLRDSDKNLCSSITEMFSEFPELEALEGLSVAQHRKSVLEGFIKHLDSEDRVVAWAHALARSLRLKHSSPMVNLPKPSQEHGGLIRSVIIAPKGYKLIGADLSSLEDKTKQISIYPLDPEYVKTMVGKGYDAHLTLGKKANFFDDDDIEFYKCVKNEIEVPVTNKHNCLSEETSKELFHRLDEKRAISKTANYGLVYGCGVPKLMEGTGLKRAEASNLHESYHKLNWAVSEYAKTRKTKVVKQPTFIRLSKKVGGLVETNEFTWVWNEYSGLWIPLKNEKDVFSACNQNFGVKIFDTWGYFMCSKGINMSFEAHDEYLWLCKDEDVERDIEIIKWAIKRVNDVFKPPIPIECDYKVGNSYAEVH